MNKEFVPYDIALAIWELGGRFNDEYLAFYNGKHLDLGVWDWEYPSGSKRRNIGECIQAPLYQQAFRWFREKNIEFQIVKNYPDDYGYDFQIKVKNKWNTYIDYETYEEAQDACLRKLIEIVRNGK